MSFGNIVLIIIVAAVGYLIMAYNRFASLRAGIDASWSDIDVQIKRRYDLIPALVDTVKGYKDYEADTLEKVIQARQQSLSADSVEEKSAAANMLTGALGKLFALAEAYPDLKANENVMHLQRTLHEVEAQISAARRAYNQAVTDYNNAIEMVPTNIMAGFMKMTRKQVFEIPDSGSV